ncbi:large ribosomal subunit protein bL35c isoform X2 [Elaeis guineensis]|uniref:50S ribosomal protein L35 n=1 Tax=Elaeis guineensis var. tenera TaxID=51953 RepID=A0A6I9R6R0_ELAGV|nr:50S ribosomal protein L35, chloroplastic isoform X1 [Elaeis guineensis]
MASSLCFTRVSTSLPLPFRCFHGVRLSHSPTAVPPQKKLGSSKTLSGSPLVLQKSLSPIPSPCQKPSNLTVFAAKGYKMKTHKASAKRFRVTGKGIIVRRRSGKQHLLAKKNTKRKLRLSKMHPVSRSDYDNVIGALPYLKVNRKAT